MSNVSGPHWSAAAVALAAVGACCAIAMGACGQTPGAEDETGIFGHPDDGTSCNTPNEACPCDQPGVEVECGHVKRISGNYASCSIGKRQCLEGNVWGACEGEVETRNVDISGLIRANALQGTPSACADPCDPYCQKWQDTPQGITLPDGGPLTVDSTGLTLNPSGTFNLSNCTGLTITPSTQTLTVTSLSPISPSTLTYTAALTPPGCYPGAVTPIWTVNDAKADSATISGTGATGTLTVASPIAGPITINAYMGSFTGTAAAQVNVNVATSTLPAYTNAFPLTTGTADTLEVLYPYANTVFPLGLPPPIPQWKVSTAASAVKVTLRYVSGATSFQWSAVTAENKALTIVSPSVSIAAAPRYPDIPTNAWSAFEQSAKGADAQVVLQRYIGAAPPGGTRYAERATTVHFANGQLKGNVYYQSYGTQLARNYCCSAQDPSGLTFPGGAFGAATLAIAPGATQPTVIAGSTGGNPPDGAGTYCRVCHTAAANGSLLITQKFGNSGLGSQIYTNLTGTPSGVDMTTADGRYAWPAIYPTGGFLFGNIAHSRTYSGGSATFPGGLDGANITLTNALYTTTAAGSSVSAEYRTAGGSGAATTYTVPSSDWGLKGAVPTFSFTGAKVAMQHNAGRVCQASSTVRCNADERTDGDKRSLAIMDFNTSVTPKRLSNFRILVNQPNTPCNTTFHPTQPCTNVWPTFLPNDTGLVWEKEIFHNGNISGGLSDFAGTRSGCDNGGVCNNDGTKGELWWTNISGTSTPTRLNAANGLNASNVSYLPVGPDVGSYCRPSGFACTSATAGSCCSGTCAGNRCTTNRRMAGSACTSNGQCESNSCVGSVCGCVRNADCAGGATCGSVTANRCPGNNYYVPPTMSYVPGHSAAVEPYLNYEPTMNPTPTTNAAGADEYYWVVFTSRRMFGNIATVDPWWSDPRHQNLSQTVTPKKLWVAAIKASPNTGTDPSYPAFYLPGQEWISGNSKAYWVQNACKAGAVTSTTANECEVNADCCAGSVCKLETPIASPAKRYCRNAAACVALNGTCSTSSDCCSGRLCSNGTCQDPPPVYAYGNSGTYNRDLTSPCTPDEATTWRFFDYQALLPTGTNVTVRARTATTSAGLAAATPLVLVGTASPPSTTGWTSFSQTIDTAFRNAGAQSLKYLRLEITLNPSSDQANKPTLTNWRTAVNCQPNE